MSGSGADNVDTFPSAIGGIARLACARAQEQGLEVELLLRTAGLTRQQIDDPDAAFGPCDPDQFARAARGGPARIKTLSQNAASNSLVR